MSTFTPALGYVEVEPIDSSGPLTSDDRKWVEKAKVLQVCPSKLSRFLKFLIGGALVGWDVEVNDIIFFRPHGFFELAEHDGKKHYVVRVSEEFILGIQKCGNDQNAVQDSGSTTSNSTEPMKTE